MQFHEFGEGNERTLLLVHDMATTWKMSFSSLIQEVSDNYHLIVVALDGHNDEEKTEFISLEEEAEKIEEYIMTKHCGKLYAAYGSSLGGTIVLQILVNQKIEIVKTVLDGPFASDYGILSSLVTKIMTTLSMKMIRSESKRLSIMMGTEGEKSLNSFIYTNISKETMENCLYSCNNYKLPKGINKVKVEIEFWYGRRESYPCKFAKKIMKQLPDMTVRVFDGYGPGEPLKNTERLVLELSRFLSNYELI